VHRSSLKIRDKESMVLVGPSGCGKTTTLHMVAGLKEVAESTVKIGKRMVNAVLSRDRDNATVFQNCAI